MENPLQSELVELLKKLGLRTIDDRLVDGQAGFPLLLPSTDGTNIVLDLPSPGILAAMDPDGIGIAILDPMGFARRTWGVASRNSNFRAGFSAFDSPIAPLVRGAHSSMFLDGYRYYLAQVTSEGLNDIVVLVINAIEELESRKAATRNARTADALKRLGKALTMNQQIQPLCNSAAHEIASVAELAAVMIWINRSGEEYLELVSSIGVNRQGQNALSRISSLTTGTCAAELVASTRSPYRQSHVADNVITANLEAKCCYLRPGGVSVHPLVISGQLIGILELIGREGDTNFDQSGELFTTIAEHFALAMNSAMLFETFEKWATHDALTGLANHRTLHDFLQQRILESGRTGQEIGLIMMDVDHFRSFNEEEGHDAGDEVLRLVAESMRACLRPYDLAGRYGGEEFTVIMPGSSLASTIATAERIRQRVEALPYLTRSGRERHVTASLGCAVFPETADEASALIKAADIALFDAKRSGRNRTIAFDGLYIARQKQTELELARVEEWISQPESRCLLERYESNLTQIAQTLNLSPSQTEILRALLAIFPTYRTWVETGEEAQIVKAELSDEFRLLTPSLHAQHERYDGKGKYGLKGPKIPLLGRVLMVLDALAVNGGEDIIHDSGKYDPEIVAMMVDLQNAA